MQNDESMNNYIAVYVTKNKNLLEIISLRTRAGIAVGVLPLGYLGFWKHVFNKLDLEMNDVFPSSFTTHDRKKKKKDKRQKIAEGVSGGRITQTSFGKHTMTKCIMQKLVSTTVWALPLQWQRKGW